jgi:hypothetical protein
MLLSISRTSPRPLASSGPVTQSLSPLSRIFIERVIGWDFSLETGRSIRTGLLVALNYVITKVEARFLKEIDLFWRFFKSSERSFRTPPVGSGAHLVTLVRQAVLAR